MAGHQEYRQRAAGSGLLAERDFWEPLHLVPQRAAHHGLAGP